MGRMTVFQRFAALSITAVLALTPTAAVAGPSGPDGDVKQEVQEQLLTFAQQYLRDKALRLTTGTPGPKNHKWTPDTGEVGLSQRASTVSVQRDAALEEARRELVAQDSVYNGALVGVEPLALTLSGTTAELDLTETTELTVPEGSATPSTAYAEKRRFLFGRDGNRWRLVEHGLIEGGESPITEDQTTPRYGPDPTTLPTKPFEPTDNSPLALYGSETPDDTSHDPGPLLPGAVPADTEFPGTLAPDPDDTFDGDAGTARRNPSPKDKRNMRAYAYRHWNSYNTKKYRTMPLDCTNFVSQILRHGGWKFDLGWYQSPDNWWYNSSNQTHTWGGAAHWSKFAMRRMWSIKSVWDMNMGDVLQYDYKADNDAKNHTMFVTKKTKNDIF